MNISQIQSLNENLTNEQISMPYPHVRLLEPSDAVALVLPELPTGDLPILCEINGVIRQLATIRKSAPLLVSLSKVSAIEYVKSKTSICSIKTAVDAMEVIA